MRRREREQNIKLHPLRELSFFVRKVGKARKIADAWRSCAPRKKSLDLHCAAYRVSFHRQKSVSATAVSLRKGANSGWNPFVFKDQWKESRWNLEERGKKRVREREIIIERRRNIRELRVTSEGSRPCHESWHLTGKLEGLSRPCGFLVDELRYSRNISSEIAVRILYLIEALSNSILLIES